MQQTHQVTALIERQSDGPVALCPELDIASQGDTTEEAQRNLGAALELFWKTASPAAMRDRLHPEMYVPRLEVSGG